MNRDSYIYFNVKGHIRRDGDIFTATCPMLGLVTCGKSIKDADRKMDKAIDLWADYLNAKGDLPKRLKMWSIDYRIADAPISIPKHKKLLDFATKDRTWISNSALATCGASY